MKLTYPACFRKDKKAGSPSYSVEVPDLAGCAASGANMAEAILAATEAASAWVLAALEKGHTLPPPSPLGNIKLPPGGFVNLLALDMDEYAKKRG